MAKRQQKRIEIDGKWYRLKANGNPGVELTHCSNTKTKAEVMSLVLSALRRATKFWKPKLDKLNEGKRAYKGTNPRQKWEYQCEKCERWFKKDDIEMDHIIPCGGIDDFSKVSSWCVKAFVEKDGYQRLCTKCHKKKGDTVDKPLKSIRATYPREEAVYRNMISRCYNKNATGYEYYGGRGIGVCARWQESFFNFYEDMGLRPDNTSLDRIDVNKGYSLDNCRWASYIEQARNTTANNYVTYNGETKCVQEWAELRNIKSNTIIYRLRRGWPVDQALEFSERVTPRAYKAKGPNAYSGRLCAEDLLEIVERVNGGESQTKVALDLGIDSSVVNRLYHRYKDNTHLLILQDKGFEC